MTASLLYAWIRSAAPPAAAFSSIYVPVTNIPKADLSLRPEFSTVLHYGGLKPSDLITLDDLNPVGRSTLDPEASKWVLVDHNFLQGLLGKVYDQRVGGVIDHHEDEHRTPIDTGCEPRIIEKAASCTSLVTEFVRKSWDNISASTTEGSQELNAEMAKMAISSILIDSVCLKDSGKVTSHDKEAALYLETKIRAAAHPGEEYDRQKLHGEVYNAKQDITHLCLNDILRKDYKEWEENGKKLGISTVVKSLQFLVDKADQERNPATEDAISKSLDEFCDHRQLDVYGIMTAFTDDYDGFKKELFLRSMHSASDATIERFQNAATEELGLSGWKGPKLSFGKSTQQVVWQQNQIQHTRKRIAPLLRGAMSFKGQ